MIELKTPTEIEAMREAGRVVATALEAVRAQVRAGVRLHELDALARTVIDEAGAKPAFLGYHPTWAPGPFPAVLCTSVNDVIVHGIPGPVRLRAGDLVSIDCGASIDGWHGDAAITVPVGDVDDDDRALMTAVRTGLEDGIAAALPGNRLGDIGRAVGVVGRSFGYGIPGSLGGHGIGRQMHEAPFVANDGRAGRGMPLRPGAVLAIEPMFCAGGRDGIDRDDNGWALRTDDGTRAAHAEHTVAITEQGPQVLTVT